MPAHLPLKTRPAARGRQRGKRCQRQQSKRSPQRLLIILTDGQIGWDSERDDFDWSVTTALPRNLGNAFAQEPLYTDLRWVRTTEHRPIPADDRPVERLLDDANVAHGAPNWYFDRAPK